MTEHFSQFLPPPEAVKILIVLVLSFLIGLEREEQSRTAIILSVGCGHFRL